MMDRELAQKLDDTVWIERSLFERSKTSGSSANISFFHNGAMYISRSGSYFDTLKTDEFAIMDMNGTNLNGSEPSREWPLRLKAYQKKSETGVVTHTHGIYGILWGFVPAGGEADVIPDHAPHLKMKLSRVGLVPYEEPGPQALFDAFEQRVMGNDDYLLKQHGAVMPGKGLMNAFFYLEELEKSARIAWMLGQAGMR